MNSKKVPDDMKWDMTPFFPSPVSQEFQVYCESLSDDVNRVEKTIDELGAIFKENSAAWVQVLLDLEKVDGDAQFVFGYVRCLKAANVNDPEIQQAHDLVFKLLADNEQLQAKTKVALFNVSANVFESLVNSPQLESARFYLTRLRDDALHSLTPELEALASDYQKDGLVAWSALYSNVASNLKFTMDWPDGRKEVLLMSERWRLVTGPDKNVRKAAYDGAMRAWETVEIPVAACLNGIAGSRLTTWRRCGYDHFLDKALFDAAMSRDTLGSMMGVIAQNRQVVWEMLEVKAQLLGLDCLGPQDLVASVTDTDTVKLSLDKAYRLVLKSFEKFCPPLAGSASQTFEGKWIDAEKRAGKVPDAFCFPVPKIKQSRIHMTWGGNMASANMLAHELGHGFHWSETMELRYWQQKQPLTLAETAATVAEGLFRKSILDDPLTTDKERVSILVAELNATALYLLHMPCMYDFEVALYNERLKGEVPISKMKSLMQKSRSEWFGESLSHSDLSSNQWAIASHFYFDRLPFYNFHYSLGYLLCQGLLNRFETKGQGFVIEYQTLLKSTGTVTVEEFAQRALGVDLSKPDFWQEAIDSIAKNLSKLKYYAKRMQTQ